MTLRRRVQEFFLLMDSKRLIYWGIPLAIGLFMFILFLYYDHEPEPFDVLKVAEARSQVEDRPMVTGYVTTATLIEIIERMLNKRGGYLSNDVTPPSVMMDNVPNWEWGVLQQVRDLTQTLRYDMSRSQSQSKEDADLANAFPNLNIDSKQWILPWPEQKYAEAADDLEKYLNRLSDPEATDAQFYARADNLSDWLALVEKRLGDLANRLNQSVESTQISRDLAGDPGARQSTFTPDEVVVKTPWLEIDDVFYEARGACWALIHMMRAIEVDFAAVLENKNATASFRQIIRDLEATQEFVWSPMVLNGSAFGFFANYSLAMGSYISQANAAVIDMRNLLQKG